MNKLKGWGLSLSFLLLLGACEKEFTLIGESIQPDEEQAQLLYLDSFPIYTSWQNIDSIRSDRTISSLVGMYRDPIFGMAESRFCTQLLLSATDIDFGPNPIADSVFLDLVYYDDGFYGPNDREVQLKVYELTERIDFDSVYYSNRSFSFDPFILGQKTFIANPDDSITIGGEPVPPLVRIELDPSIAQKVLDVSNGPELESNANFTEYLNGLYIRATQGNSILKFHLPNIYSQLTFWYHTDDEDSLTFVLNLNEFSQRVNMFTHNHALGPIGTKLPPGSPMPETYAQGISGVQSVVRIEGLDSLIDRNYIVNKAELCFKRVEGSDLEFEGPDRLILARIDTNGERAFVPDQLLEPDAYFDGYFNEKDGTYCFNIARYLHQLINEGEENSSLVLLVSGNAINPSRLIMHGQDAVNPNDRPKLELVLTK
jgi:hypothetical protein